MDSKRTRKYYLTIAAAIVSTKKYTENDARGNYTTIAKTAIEGNGDLEKEQCRKEDQGQTN